MWSTQRETSISCGVQYYDSSIDLRIIHVALFTFQSFFFILRMVSRAVRLAPWGRDDTTIVIAWVFSVGYFGGSMVETTLRVGAPFWARTFSQIDKSLLYLFVCQVFYNLVLGIVKISICFLYMRVFPGREFQRVMWAVQVFIATVTAAFFFAGSAQCQPLSAFWTSWDGVRVGKCFNINAFAYAHASIHIALDVCMLVLPAIQVWKLNMTLRRKVEVTLMFSVGGFITATSIVRLTTLHWFAENPLEIRSFYATAIWSTAEIMIGIFVACIPSARILIVTYAGIALKATGLLRPERSYPSQQNKNSGNSSGDGHARHTLSSAYKLRIPSRSDSRMSSSIGRELGEGEPGRAAERTSLDELTGWGSYSSVDVELENVASKDEPGISSRAL